MTAADWAGLGTAITAIIGSVTSLLVAYWHIQKHDATGNDKPAETPVNSTPNTPANPGPAAP